MPDPTTRSALDDLRASLRDLDGALAAHRRRNGVDVEVHAPGGWRDVRAMLAPALAALARLEEEPS